MRRLLSLLFALAAAGCAEAPSPSPPAAGFTTGVTREGGYTVGWRVAGAARPPFNRHFELEVRVERDGAPVEGAQVFARADMPGHGHGMQTEPRSRELGAGEYLVAGMLMHMTGHWVLSIDVITGGTAHTVDFDLAVELD
jgi:hypothetical protein